MSARKSFTIEDYQRMAAELEEISELMRLQPEMNHDMSERLKVMAAEMRADAKSEFLLQLPPEQLAKNSN
jgi:hypothetical protein